jgi:hypothetical protein
MTVALTQSIFAAQKLTKASTSQGLDFGGLSD